MVEGELVWANTAIRSLPSTALDHKRLGRQLGVSLGPQQSRKNQCCLAPSSDNDVARPSRKSHLSPERHMRSAPTAFPYGLRNAAATACHLMALRMVQTPANSEFMGVIEHDAESLHKLLIEEPESSSSSGSSMESHHPSRECFMADTSEGHVESVSEGDATATANPDMRNGGKAVAPSHVRTEQLRARKLEIDDAGQQLVREYQRIDEEIKRHGDGGRARATAHDVYQRILTDDGAHPHFARAS